MAERQTYIGVQALRGIAAAMVVVHHATELWSTVAGGYRAPHWENGAAGVDIFFVISGFVMMVSTFSRGSTHPSAKSFLERRITRVVPLYWLMTLAFVLRLEYHLHRTHAIAQGADRDVTLRHLIESLTLIPYRNVGGMYMPILSVGWSLSFEMLFYLLFATMLAVRVGVVRALTPLLVGLAAVGMFRHDSWPAVTFLLNPLLLEFLAGLWIGHLALKGFRAPEKLTGILGLIAFPILFVLPVTEASRWRVAGWGLLAVVIVQAVVTLERSYRQFVPHWLLLVGDASYSLYLSHMMVFSLMVHLLMRAHVLRPGVTSVGSEILATVVLLVIALLAAIPLYMFVEAPILAFFRRRTRTSVTLGGRPIREADPA